MNSTPIYGWPYPNRSTDQLTYGIMSGEDMLLAIEATVAAIQTTATAAAASLAAVQARQPRTVYKAADEPLASSTSFQPDDHLTIAFTAGIPCTIHGWLPAEGATAADLRARLSWTGTVNWLDWGLVGQALGVTTAEGDMKTQAEMGDTTSPSAEIHIGTLTSNWTNSFIAGFISPSTDGVLTLEWAQVNSNVTNTILKRGAHLGLIPIGV